MMEAGEVDIAIDELRWLLSGCSDFIEAHRLLGELALAENDLPLARAHFGYAYSLYVSSIAGGHDPAERRAALAAAARLLDSTPTEAKNLSDLRELAGQIATARAAKQG